VVRFEREKEGASVRRRQKKERGGGGGGVGGSLSVKGKGGGIRVGRLTRKQRAGNSYREKQLR